MASVTLTNVSKTYAGNVPAVRSVSIDIADGEFLVLVGPSGCGKTTTLRMVAGLETLTDGTITIDGRDVSRVDPRDRDVAMVFQDYALYPHMTVRKNLSFGLKMRKTPKDEIAARVADVAALLGLDAILDRRPGELSGGQQQRVALGRAIVRRPACYLFDEPLSNLDAKLRLRMRGELKSLHRRLGTTSIYVTHDQAEAMTLGDRLVVMAEGEVRQVGAPLEVYREPADRFVAGFLGSPPMSFVEGELLEDGGALKLRAAGTTIELKDELAAAARAAGTREVALGMRPENVTVATAETNGAMTFDVDVDVVEALGDRTYARAHLDGTELVATAAPDQVVDAGSRARFAVEPRHALLFEAGAFGRRINTSG